VWLALADHLSYRLGSAIKTTIRLTVRRKFNVLLAYWRGLLTGLADS